MRTRRARVAIRTPVRCDGWERAGFGRNRETTVVGLFALESMGARPANALAAAVLVVAPAVAAAWSAARLGRCRLTCPGDPS
jgi:hypothetical protein